MLEIHARARGLAAAFESGVDEGMRSAAPSLVEDTATGRRKQPESGQSCAVEAICSASLLETTASNAVVGIQHGLRK